MILNTANLGYKYQESGRGIRQVFLSAASGELTALVGPSGSGKSTILACIAGVLIPSAGSVSVGDDSSATIDRKTCALITQNSSLFEELCVWENVALAFGLPGTATHKLALSVLEKLSIRELADSLPSGLSQGQRQRVAIASALAQKPQVLLADEPTGSLDAANANLVMSALRAIARKGSVVLIATHDPQIMAEADKIINLNTQQVSR